MALAAEARALIAGLDCKPSPSSPHRYTDALLNSQNARPRLEVSFGTMDINALVISGSDPGAVPGDSTKTRSFDGHGVEIGSTNV